MSTEGFLEEMIEDVVEEMIQDVVEENKERYIYYLGDFDNINVYVKFPNNNLMKKKPILEVKKGDLLFTNDSDFFTVEEIQKFEMQFGDDEPERLIGLYMYEDTYKPGKAFVMEKNGRVYNFPPLNNSRLIDEKICPEEVYKIIKKNK